MKYREAKELFIKEFDKQTVDFLEYLHNTGFIDVVNNDDMKDLTTPMFFTKFTHNGIKIAMMKCDGHTLFGVDPSNCFDKLTRSSIILKFPMSNREYHRAFKLMFEILNKNSNLHKRWIKEAPTSWYGAFYGRKFLTD